ncbi:GntR family transcriptional regulator, regulator for abcA and norABC [Evansella caseinilytica]|uniref:GntR family transcriptional regulator, regulator for abcA and norABC n=1 Tax=Evansella caseinilytica TaxID=1503961 RepID=A0A1H3SWC4_9BACI|nr:PLP-dependent aminotransferase family protein [Evansella caseinilytica]SDZ41429.1 GntR family transcriptional regulator, regulator for abcA and norABC [Evansella caseinilytica]
MLFIDWKPNKQSPVPLHRQIADFMKEKIANGEWTVGFKLPPQRTLAKIFAVNRSTVVAAYDELTAEGLIEGKSGSGTTVANNTWSLLASASPLDWKAYVNSGTHHPNLPTIQEINQAEFFPGIIRLGTGELAPELMANEAMQHVLRKLPSKVRTFGYEEPKGLYALRQGISAYLKTTGIHASPASVLIVSGALQALQLISIGLLHRGAAVLTEKPSYLQSLHVFQSAGIQLTGIPLDEEGMKVNLIPSYIKQHRPAFLYTIPSFHNPTGTLMTAKRRKQLLSICQKERLPIIEDDVYRELWFEKKPPEPLKTADETGLVLYLGSLSKTVSPGLRIGWLVGPEAVIDRLADIKMQTDYGSSTLSQWAAAEWLTGGLYEQHLNNVRMQLLHRRETALKALSSYFSNLATWKIPRGGFYVWLQLLPGISIKKLFDTALADGILLNPGNVYDQHADRYLRISYSYASPSDIEDGLRRLAGIVTTLLRAT